MKKNVLSNMADIVLLDKEGNEATIHIKLFGHNGKTYVFLADSNRYSPSSIARHTATYISQVVERLKLDASTTLFFRHIHTPESGSVFGQFYVTWQDDVLASYNFKMLSHLDQAQIVNKVIGTGEPIRLSLDQQKLSAAV